MESFFLKALKLLDRLPTRSRMIFFFFLKMEDNVATKPSLARGIFFLQGKKWFRRKETKSLKSAFAGSGR